MVPFDVKINGKKVGISWESLFWFFVVTAGATVVGELVYDKWVSPYLADLPNLPFGTPTTAATPTIAPNDASVVSTQTPAMGRIALRRRARSGSV
jgi:hypothetical protein